MFVCLFAVNAKTTERIDAKCSGITKNDSVSVLWGLSLPVLVLSRRYRDISGFSIAPDHHNAKSRLHIFQCMPSLTFLQLYEHCKCNYASDMHGQVHVHAGMAYKFNHDMHACLARNYPEALSCCGHGHDLISVAQLSIISIADIRSAFDKTLVSERFRRNAVDGAQ